MELLHRAIGRQESKMWNACMQMLQKIQNRIPASVCPLKNFECMISQADDLDIDISVCADPRLGLFFTHIWHSMIRYGDIHSLSKMPLEFRMRWDIFSIFQRNYILITESFEKKHNHRWSWSDNASARILCIIQNKQNSAAIIPAFIDLSTQHFGAKVIEKDINSALCLGALMMFCCKDITDYLHTTNAVVLSKKFLDRIANAQKYKRRAHAFSFHLARTVMALKERVFEKGQHLFERAFALYNNFGSKSVSCYECLLKAQYDYQIWACSGNVNARKSMINAFVACIVSSTSLYSAVSSMRALSAACKKIGQYLIALRLLDKAYECCTMYQCHAFPSFVSESYWKKRKRIKQKLNKLRCSYCGCSANLLSCTGCMSTFYCSKLCQKMDWKMTHSDNCDKHWSGRFHFDMLRQIL